MEQRIRVEALLIDLEAALRNRLLWDSEPPGPAALASTQPFCIDTLGFPQWLQFVFLPRMRALLAGGHALPAQCAIAEMGEVVFDAAGGAELVALLREIDRAVAALAGEPGARG